LSAPPDDAALIEALAVAQRLGMLGAAPIAATIAHSDAFVAALAGTSGTVVDLGSGGGVPGLVIAWRRPDLDVVLVDRRAARTDHLRRMVARLDLGGSVRVLTVEAARLRSSLGRAVEAVVARGFGSPPDVLAAAAPVLASGGLLVVSEPPDRRAGERWPSDVLDETGWEWVDQGRLAVLRRR
jgi:16S rRNA (guanine527-N7)-methyltransferase